MAIRTRKPAEALWRSIFQAIPPAPASTVSEWTEEHRSLSRESSFQTGRMKCHAYQREPMDAPLEDGVSETVLWWAAQLGKSETVNSISGFFMHADPSPQLFVQPTVDLAKEYSKDRIATMIRDCRVLRGLVKDPRSRDSGNTTLSKRYPGGSLVMVGANAPSGLAGRPRRVILLDEVDRFPSSAGSEGDPCALADKRAETFPNAVKVKTSTATIKGLSKIENLYEQSDKRRWNVKCRKCSHEFVMMWAHVQWPENKPEDAFLQCPGCGHHAHDVERIAMVKDGRWVATAPFKGIRGYWLNGINTLSGAHKSFRNRLHQFVAEFLKAKDGGAETMRVWTNTFLAETYEEEAMKLDAAVIIERLEEYTPESLPEEVLMLTAAGDVHRDRIECELKGWGRDDESWGITKKVFYGDTRNDEVWAELDAFLVSEFERVDGVKLKVVRAFIDMGYRQSEVLKFCAPRIGRGVYPCRGVNRVGLQVPPILPAKPSQNNKARIPHWNVGVTVAKTALYDRIELPVPGARSMHFPNGYGYDDEYFKQFTAEKRRIKYSFGQAYFIFEKENNSVRNEALDLNVYNLAALHSLSPIAWTKLAENMKKTATRKPEGAPAPEPKPEEPKLERTLRGEPKPPPITKAEIAAAVAENKADASAPPKPPEPKPEPPPVNYTNMMIARRPGRGRRGGWVQGWR